MGIRIDDRWVFEKLNELNDRYDAFAASIRERDNLGAAVSLRDVIATARALLRQMEERDILNPDQ